jgi:hypothetical protein
MLLVAHFPFILNGIGIKTSVNTELSNCCRVI